MYFIQDGNIYRQADGVQVAPCQSLDEPNYIDYIAWVESGGVEEIREDILPKEVIKLTMSQARRMLHKVNYDGNITYLDKVDAVIDQLGSEAKIQWEYETFVHSDNKLVNYVLGTLVGLSEYQIYDLFEQALKL